MQTIQSSQTFLLPTDRGVKAIAVDNLVRIEAVSNYSKLHFADGKTLVVARVLRKFETELSGRFLRVHHKHLVNRCWLSDHNASGNKIELGNGEVVGISRRKKKATLIALAQPFGHMEKSA